MISLLNNIFFSGPKGNIFFVVTKYSQEGISGIASVNLKNFKHCSVSTINRIFHPTASVKTVAFM